MDEQFLNTIYKIIEKVSKDSTVTKSALQRLDKDSSLSKDLAMDSLTQLEFFHEVQKTFNLDLPQERVFEIDTLAELENLILTNERISTPILNQKIKKAEDQQEKVNAFFGNTLLESLFLKVNSTPDKPHIHFYNKKGGSSQISFKELWSAAKGVALSLRIKGIKKDDRVAIMLPTGPDYFFAFIGVQILGAVPVPLYPPLKKSQITEHITRHIKILNNCNAKALISTKLITGLSLFLKPKTNVDFSFVISDLKQEDIEIDFTFGEPEDIALIQYTSGSTGDPKGVIVSNKNIIENIKAMGDVLNMSSKEVVVSWLPLYHDMGLIGAWLSCLYYGSPLILMSPIEFILEPKRWLWAISNYKGTISVSPNFGYELCIKKINDDDIKNLDLKSWRIALNGAEPVNPFTIFKFTKKFKPYGFNSNALMPVYGLAENTLALTFPPNNRAPKLTTFKRSELMKNKTSIELGEAAPTADKIILPSVGVPLPKNKLRIVDADGRPLNDENVGEIEFKGPSTTRGYYNNPLKTKELFNDGWAKSGDLGFIHKGELYISGRKKDLIIKAGKNIFPQDLEYEIGNLDGVRKGNVAAFSTSKNHNGFGDEKLIVALEVKETDEHFKQELKKKINTLSLHLIQTTVDDIVFLPKHSILKTSSGKLRRSAIKQRYIDKSLNKNNSKKNKRAGEQTIIIFQSTVSMIYKIYYLVILALTVIPTILLVRLIPESIKWKIAASATKLFLKLTFIKYQFDGQENLPLKNEPAIFIANHQSFIDAPILIAFLSRPLVFLAKFELTKNRIFNFILKPFHPIFINRANFTQAIEKLKLANKEIQKGGSSLCIFPEGQISRKNQLSNFHKGAFYISSKTNTAIYPIVIEGTTGIFGKDSFLPNTRPRLKLKALKPIRPNDFFPSKDEWEMPHLLSKQAYTEISKNFRPNQD